MDATIEREATFVVRFMEMAGLFKPGYKELFLKSLNEMPASKHKIAIKMAVRDLVEHAKILSVDLISRIDKELESENLPRFYDVRVKYVDDLNKLLNSGVIKNDVDFYFLRGAVDSGMLNSHEVGKVVNLLDKWEFENK